VSKLCYFQLESAAKNSHQIKKAGCANRPLNFRRAARSSFARHFFARHFAAALRHFAARIRLLESGDHFVLAHFLSGFISFAR
jgi:hypothetical protein